MSKVASKAIQTALDVIALALVFIVAFELRFDWSVPRDLMVRCLTLLPYVVAFKYFILHRFDVPRFSWRYIGLREVTRIFQALLAASMVLLVLRIVAIPLSHRFKALGNIWVPVGIILIDFVLAFCAIVGLRAGRRIVAERTKRSHAAIDSDRVPTILVGAGQAGLAVARSLEEHPLKMRVVGFVDDDPMKVGTMVHGIPVLATTAQLTDVARTTQAGQILVTFSRATGKDIRKLRALAEAAGVKLKIIPGIHDIVGGHVNLSRVRDVAIEDLLRRDPIILDETAISEDVRGRVVLVTGAGGSIGSELCRQISRFEPKRLVLLEQAENALFEIHRELIRTSPDLDVVPVIADITDLDRIRTVFRAQRPHFVLHAAAHKHVPMMEWNPGEAVKNNVFGTKTVADVSNEVGVANFVMISTDKAVNPTSVMGATKRVAELYIQSLSSRSQTKFVAVRFGNVLGSAGSVIPIFQDQIARGGPVTVTDPDMRRYFMTIPEASQLVLQAAAMGHGGEIFILDMGEPVRIVDLASDLIRLSGLRPGEDIEIQFTGLRPGEKLFEELSVASENADTTRHPKIFVGKLAPVELTTINEALATFQRDLDRGPDRIRARLAQLVPEYTPPAPTDRPSSEGATADRESIPLFALATRG
ncbi:MAG: nucleoside-diphosphate sugar epimerase/dehydratase [Polyangiaceae bacterium]